ncbi:MAG: NfeD family protein [Phycisphaerales bacterium]
MEPLLLWGLGLLVAALLLLLMEFFVPSAGLIAVLASGCAIAGLVCLFRFNPLWGMLGLVGMLFAVPATLYAGVSIWQNTPFGRRMIGIPSEDEVAEKAAKEDAFARSRMQLLNKEGIVITDLRPVGQIEIDGVRHDALCDSDFLRPGARVRVVHVDANQVRVRAVS